MSPPVLRLSSWPYVVVRIDCRLCSRKGCYRLARLAVRYGPDFEMAKLLAHLASDCPWWRSNPRKYDPRCGARFVDLDRAAVPDLPAGLETAVLRQRMPARENVPQRRSARATPSPTWAPPMLSGWPAPTIVVTCRVCGRWDAHEVAAILARGDVRLTDLRGMLTADCPQRDAAELRERCDTRFESPEPPPGAPTLRVAGGRG